MNMISKLINIVVLVSLFTLGSCKSDDYVEHFPNEGKLVPVQLTLKLGNLSSPGQTRSNGDYFSVEVDSVLKAGSRATKDSLAIHNLWIFQFNSSGAIQGKPQKVSTSVKAIGELATIEVPLTVGKDQTLYLVSLGKNIEKDFSKIANITELSKASINYLEAQGGEYASLIDSPEAVPYAGFISGVEVLSINNGEQGLVQFGTPGGFAGGIPMQSLVSLVTLKYKYEVTGNDLLGVRLYNVCNTLLINNNNNPIKDYYPQYVSLKGSDIGEADADGYYTAQWYVASNRQGTVSTISSESLRFRYTDAGTIYGDAPEYATYLECVSAETEIKDALTTHQIYVGKNNTTNFDIDPNYHYTLRTTINMKDNKDGRVRNSTAQLKVVPNSTDIFDCHFGYRVINVYASGHEVEIGIYSEASRTTLADANDPRYNWAKISASPNYTEAVNSKTKPTNYLKTEVKLPSKLRFYIYLDEYVLSPEGEIPTKETSVNLSNRGVRSLYYKVTISKDGKVVKSYLTGAIYQHPMVYMGRFGGNFVDGQYEKYLGMERITERDYLFDPDVTKPASLNGKYVFGYYNKDRTAAGYDTDNLYNGRKATRFLAENPKSLEINSLISGLSEYSFDNPHTVGGVPDLYQYNYYNSFAPRTCYDLNRDENGNGVIDDEELKWYLPAAFQLMGYWVFSEKAGELKDDPDIPTSNFAFTTLQFSITRGFGVHLENGHSDAINLNSVSTVSVPPSPAILRCVREFEIPDNKTNRYIYR